ncbi:hypothetical protein [Paenibacillus sp. BC26]|uniref:hypothetical protein n=1 Tax=Paenibacillus sp. BC26 TaxID=1881032 RepID=UPI00116065BB|nr:hypothetical protein [Paenibacillus sp. BC26]
MDRRSFGSSLFSGINPFDFSVGKRDNDHAVSTIFLNLKEQPMTPILLIPVAIMIPVILFIIFIIIYNKRQKDNKAE